MVLRIQELSTKSHEDSQRRIFAWFILRKYAKYRIMNKELRMLKGKLWAVLWSSELRDS
jgi:hypothetical protein